MFLDANVLYSAAYLEQSRIGELWNLDDVELLSSAYAIEEARRNLVVSRPAALGLLRRLVASVAVVTTTTSGLPSGISLETKDRPILWAAIHGGADVLLTGDQRHFGRLYGRRIEGVLILRPAQYFERRRKQ
ncbi:MAG TPA: PIN domain-containing protein [Candidatus Binataceae bacterium]|nr:PIN domain-containing protein [Candidatus Binataceae bacterium]